MTSIAYPASLPVPQAAPIQSTERRAVASEEGPYQVRALQRDRHAVQRITLPPLNEAQSATFQAWWQNDLFYGGSWFAATWPLPQGMVAAVRRFMGPPHWELLRSPQGNYWRISFDCEVRGRGELPGDDCTEELFFDLSAFSETHGAGGYGANLFTLTGDGGLMIAAPLDVVVGQYAEIARAMPTTPVRRITFSFRILTAAGTDTGGIVFYDGADQVLGFLARRGVVDPDQRPMLLTPGGAMHYMGTEALPIDEDYTAEIVIDGSARITLTRESNGDTLSLVVPGVAPVPVTALAFSVDLEGLSSVIVFRGIHVC